MLISNKDSNDLVLLDHEYAGLNPLEYEIANFIIETRLEYPDH